MIGREKGRKKKPKTEKEEKMRQGLKRREKMHRRC